MLISIDEISDCLGDEFDDLGEERIELLQNSLNLIGRKVVESHFSSYTFYDV